ncbi:hypothetical protein NKG05_23760 [Oerskovia sp. M15]
MRRCSSPSSRTGSSPRAHARRRARRPGPGARSARHGPALGPVHRRRPDHGSDGAVARGPPAPSRVRGQRHPGSVRRARRTSPTDGVRLLSADQTRVIVRPSGTEPKVKCYLEVIVPVAPDASYDDLTAARAFARTRLDHVRRDVAAALGI